jgi:hypothetical protein
MADMPKQQAHQGCKGEDHDRVVQGHLGQGKQGVAIGQLTPDENHCGTRCRCEQNESGHVAVQLIGRQQGGEQVTDEQPAQEGHREGLHQPVYKEGHADTADVLLDRVQRAEIDLDQHRDDHYPDQQPHGQIDLSHLKSADALEHAGRELAQADAHHDTQEDPYRQVALEDTHWCASSPLGGCFTLGRHGIASQA